jgi:hypothetical protein
VKLRLLEIGQVARAKGPLNQETLKQRYGRLLDSTSRVVGQAKRFSGEIGKVRSDRRTSWSSLRWKVCVRSSIR